MGSNTPIASDQEVWVLSTRTECPLIEKASALILDMLAYTHWQSFLVDGQGEAPFVLGPLCL